MSPTVHTLRVATAWFQQPLFSLFSHLNFLLFKICGSSQSLTFGFLLLAAAVTLTDGNAPSPAIIFEVVQSHPLVFAFHAKPVRGNFHIYGIQFAGNKDPVVASFIFL